MTKGRFSAVPGVEPRFSLSLVDLCNGIDCVSQGQFPAEVVIEMAGHIIVNHTPDDIDTNASLTGILVDESAHEDEPTDHAIVH